MPEARFLAFDIGAESGRAVAATLDGGRVAMEEILRFPNEPAEIAGTIHWDILAIYNGVLKGMKLFADRFGGAADGLGIDTWGVDFGLLASDGSLLQNPVTYRDRRTNGILEEVGRRIGITDLFRRTGMSPSPIWSACQLLAMRLARSPILDTAATLLMIPDLLGYFLTGRKVCERTNAINTWVFDPRSRQWDDAIVKAFDVPRGILPELIDPGTVLGSLRESVRSTTGWKRGDVVAPCTHDTGSAVAAVPGKGDDWAFISSGTWSAIGAPTQQVITTEFTLSNSLCNELTSDGLFLCRNIMGLWLLQQARRSFGEATYESLVEFARHAPLGGPLLNPEDVSFLAPENMMDAITEHVRGTGQKPPEGPAEVTRSVLESLALCFRLRLEQISEIVGRKFRVLHLVGGGSKNSLLCQFTANATGLPVIAGPAEATVLGNVLVQALALGHLGSPAELRDTIRRSFMLSTYEPQDAAYWDDRFDQYCRITRVHR